MKQVNNNSGGIAKNRRRASGFTFIEIVISVSILAVIMAVTFSALTQIIRSKKILDDARDGKAIADSILTRMVRELQLAMETTPLLPLRTNLDKPLLNLPRLLAIRKELPGGIRTTELSFVTWNNTQFHPDGEVVSDLITYRVEPDPEDTTGQRLRLIREEVPLISPPADAYKKTLAFPISHDIVQFEFLFFDNTNETWVDNWGQKPPRKELPSLVQLLFKIRSPLGAVQSYSTIVYLPASAPLL